MFKTFSLAFNHHHDGTAPGGDVQRFIGRIEDENLSHASPENPRHANGVTKSAL